MKNDSVIQYYSVALPSQTAFGKETIEKLAKAETEGPLGQGCTDYDLDLVLGTGWLQCCPAYT